MFTFHESLSTAKVSTIKQATLRDACLGAPRLAPLPHVSMRQQLPRRLTPCRAQRKHTSNL
ncbi:hypothetical protein CBOM_07970 [Ceraceosorus bombacis]|uniref:Uncharacterized protein n=1 Tax=Ceraceosorus bombacis TaxID=401625 RepID=A0A0P1BT03_9BASI|nr:hypothetical protein CBOM_07970 [Ceraceosorus bombacis]